MADGFHCSGSESDKMLTATLLSASNELRISPVQIFRPPSPSSPSHDPFLHSPTTSRSQPHLPGSSRSPSPSSRTPPFPGPGIEAIPDIDGSLDNSIGVGLLFAGPDDIRVNRSTSIRAKDEVKTPVPNPYAASSSESEVEIEVNLDEVAAVRRSLLRSHSAIGKPVSERAKKGWLAHQSIFPPSSSSSSGSESDKETEDETGDDEPSRKMGKSRQKTASQSRDRDGGGDMAAEGFLLSQSELYHVSTRIAPYNGPSDLEEPLLGPDDLEADRDGRSGKVPVRLQVYHGRFGHWQREGLRKYKGECGPLESEVVLTIRRLWFPGSMVDSSARRGHWTLLRLGIHRRQYRSLSPFWRIQSLSTAAPI